MSLGKDKNLSSVTSLAALERAMTTMPFTSAIDKIMASMPSTSAIDKMMASMPSTLAIDKMMGSMPSTLAIDKMMASMPSTLAIDKMMASMPSTLAIDKIMASMPSTLAIDKIMATMPSTLAIDKIMASMPSTLAIDKMMASMPSTLSVDDMLSTMTKEIAQYNNSIEISVNGKSNNEDDLVKFKDQISEVEDAKSFLAVYKKIPPWFQIVLLFFILNVFLPNVNSITANLLTPMIKSYLFESNASNREKIKNIKKLPLAIENIDTTNLRFISAENVILRKRPSIKSEILDLTVLGQVVTVVSKKRNWIEIKYKYEDGEILHGWVFTRYTAKFIKFR